MISGLVGFPERVFVLIALGTGLLVLALVPPFKGADERAHFLRTYQVSEGTILPEKTPDGVGGFLPGRLKARASLVSPPDRTFLDFRNTALYSPVPYLPQATIIGMGRFLDLPPGTLLYLGRLAGLITAVTLTFLAIRTAPIGKLLFLLMALTPMAVRQMALLTADSVSNASAFLLIAIFLRLSLDPEMRLQRGVLVLLVLCSLVVVLSKQTYFPLLALYFLCPVTKAGSRWRYAAIFLIMTGAGLALLAAWSLAIRPLYLPQHIAPGADPGRQLAVILADPIRFALLLLADLRHDPFRYLGGGHLAYAPRALQRAALAAIALVDRKSTRLNSSHIQKSRMPSSA